MATYAKAAKCYSMKGCDRCNGEGRGTTVTGNAWICTNCDGTGKVSIYPPGRSIWAGYSTRGESRGSW